jgi:hypothetical protein
VVTTIPNEVAKRRPANVPAQRRPVPARTAIEGEIVARPLYLWRLAGWFALVIGAVLFAGLLLSLMQQHV